MKKVVLVLGVVGCRDAAVSAGTAVGPAASITVSSAAFAAEAPIPVDHTCDGTDQSPQLSWTAVPTTAKTLAVIVDDPDAPRGTFTHWIAWNIASETRTLGTGGSGGLGGGMAGTNDFGHVGYSGPCPPKGKLHHYRFSVYGLDTTLSLKQGDKRGDLDHAMTGHIVAQGTLPGTFQH
jgi:Raf kinase inhibitor-like YbhB/YbcL family protein